MALNFLHFIKELPKRYNEIGSVIPSSPVLARSMCKGMKVVAGAKNILEVGPGTGPFTREILKMMSPLDNFTICEINQGYMQYLKASLKDNLYYQKNKDRVTFFQGPVQELKNINSNQKFDVIISALPFASFPANLVQEILDYYLEVISENGHISFFQYPGLKKASYIMSSNENRDRIRKVEQILHSWCSSERGSVEKEFTFLNVPPAVSVHFKAQKQ
ncbi:MAG: methyltransferase domain-containing protein [Proteobacteria bacterium]|nr:methyltransferase domain-containing protein [Pseudomonadota bacterium]